MDRIELAQIILRDSKTKGLNVTHARHALIMNGYSDAEIEQALGKFDYQGKNPLHSESTPRTNQHAQQSRPGWINSAQAQVITCAAAYALVWITGTQYISSKDAVAPIIFFGVVGLTTLAILYYGFVAKVMSVGRYRQKVYYGQSAYLVCLIWLAALGITTYQILRLHR